MDYRKDIGLLYENILIDEAAGALNYWLTPDAKLLKVDNHMNYAADNFNLGYSSTRDGIPEDVYSRSYKLGYIRVVEDSSTIYFSYTLNKKPSKEQFIVLFNLAQDKNKNLVDGETQKVIAQNNQEQSDSVGSNEQLSRIEQDLQPS